jgi:hypothetical protein
MPTLKELTDAAGIEHVVWVDDLFDEPAHRGHIAADVELRELAARLVERKASVTIADKTLGPDHTTDEWMNELDELQQGGTGAGELRAALTQALGAGDAAAPPDYNDAAIDAIIASFGADMVTKVGSAKWPDVKATLDADKRTLLIVDREFSIAGVSTPFGEDVLRELVKAKEPKVHIVMLTRSVEQDTETLRADLAARLEISRHDFEVTAKTVSEEAGAAETALCSSFQRIFTHQVCMNITRNIRVVMADNLKHAVDEFASQSVYDLDRAVFQNSLIEGASELDVLTRILLLRQRVAVDVALAAGNEYFDQLAKLRALRDLAGALKKEGHEHSPLLKQWRWDEVCDPGERLNPAHAPLACGDVFARSDSTDYFILLGQPCDLAVRKDGHRNTHEAIFVRVKAWDPVKELENKRAYIGSAHHFFPIPAAPLPGADSWRLDFRKWASVNVRLLDFAVFSGNGALRLDLAIDPPVFLLPGWKRLLERAKNKFRALQGNAIPSDFSHLSLSGELRGTITTRNGDNITLAYSRVGRLRAPWAVAAFAAFASYQARAAFDHDFARVLPDTGPH